LACRDGVGTWLQDRCSVWFTGV